MYLDLCEVLAFAVEMISGEDMTDTRPIVTYSRTDLRMADCVWCSFRRSSRLFSSHDFGFESFDPVAE
jgi:hypothetical protein